MNCALENQFQIFLDAAERVPWRAYLTAFELEVRFRSAGNDALADSVIGAFIDTKGKLTN